MTRRKLRDEPRWITDEILVLIHAQQIERYGGLHGVLDKNVVLAALARPINHWSYDVVVDLAELAALYLVAFAGTQGFNDGNKRTGLACALVFLALNDAELKTDSDELYELTLKVATKKIKEGAVATWMRARL